MDSSRIEKGQRKLDWIYIIAETVLSFDGFITFFFLVSFWGDFSQESLAEHYGALGMMPASGIVFVVAGVGICVTVLLLCKLAAGKNRQCLGKLLMEFVGLGYAGYMFSIGFWGVELNSKAVGSEILGFILIIFAICIRIADRKRYYHPVVA